VLRELLPAGAAVTLLANPINPNTARATEEMQVAAGILGVRLLTVYTSSPSDIEAAFANMDRQETAGLLTTADPIFFNSSIVSSLWWRAELSQLSIRTAFSSKRAAS
jgi:hypothetical protein